jgi:2-polyprenyl-3-methyl-5-hydroxy-6-metoxy-1,4-benzoquinol methylase
MQVPQSASYPEHPREELIDFIPQATSVLDVGCAAGGWGGTLRQHLGPNARLVGIEAVSSQAQLAASAGFDEVHCGYFPDDMPVDAGRFELITFNDVLEHTVDPWSVLVEAHNFLAPGGQILASLPNIQFAPVLVQLLRGRWDYQDDGSLDRTHLRFFTRATMIELFETSGFEVDRVEGINPFGQSYEASASPAVLLAIRAARSLTRNAQFCQFVLVGRSAKRAKTSAAS